MKFRSCGTVYRRDLVNHPWNLGEGEYYIGEVNDHGIFYFMLYCGIPENVPNEMGPRIHGLPLYQVNEAKMTKPGWLWNGNVYAPTLRPSIACGPKSARVWHGHLTDGVFVACG